MEVIILLLLISLSCFLYNVLNLGKSSKTEISQRLNYIRHQTEDSMPEDELSTSFKERIIKPVLEGVGKAVLRLAPKEMIAGMESKIIMAGKPYNWGVKNWLGIQAFMILGLPVLILLLYIQFRMDVSDLILIIFASALIGLLFPNMLLNTKIRKRQSEISKSLPDIMDLLTVSVEAGLTFDSALSKVVEKMPGPLAREFETVLQEIKVGKTKKEALYQMSDRIGIQDLRSFVGAVVQADQLGVSLGRVLRLQSEQIRQNRKQRISEKAMKAPIKMLIPMVVFIFPVIFIVLLGPVVINLIGMFAK
ncbi:MAG TPA: type II secretion system F family protein [Clostridiaceae bacterium]|nr:type II secretion system F family protein [Clostridiaceae bacterium]